MYTDFKWEGLNLIDIKTYKIEITFARGGLGCIQLSIIKRIISAMNKLQTKYILKLRFIIWW